MSNYISRIKEQWKSFWTDKPLRMRFILTVIMLAVILNLLQYFLAFVETRPGAVIDDPILKLFQPIDVTWLTFFFIYFGLLTALSYLIQYPKQLLLALTGYGIIVFFRIIGMYMLPLDPPALMIALDDPIVEFFGKGDTLTRDLFFSGHTSLMFLFFLVIKNSVIKKLYLFGTVSIAVCVIIQYVHYSVDVYVALFVAYASYKIAQKVLRTYSS